MRVILTGGIGTGKSTVLAMFSKQGAKTYVADLEAKRLMTEDKDLKFAISELFGSLSYLEDGSLNRSLIADIVFRDKSKLTALNALVHPAVERDFKAYSLRNRDEIVIYESALVTDCKDGFFDVLICVTAPLEERLKRVGQRDGMKSEDILLRIKNQISEQDYRVNADFVVENKDLTTTKSIVLEIYNKLLSMLKN
jgi:dephospho-CoA kinase